MQSLFDVKFASYECHILFRYDIILAEHIAVHTCTCHNNPQWKRIHSLYRSDDAIFDLTFTGANNEIIS